MNRSNLRNLRSLQSATKQKGLTLIEIGLALVIVLVVGALVFTQFSQTSSAQQADQAQKATLSLLTGAKSLAQGNRFTGLSNTVMNQAGKVPEGMGNGAVINNPFGGTFEVIPASVAGGTDNAVQICLTNVPRSECSSLVTGSAGTFGRVVVGANCAAATTIVKDRWAATPVVQTTASVAGACDSATRAVIFTAI